MFKWLSEAKKQEENTFVPVEKEETTCLPGIPEPYPSSVKEMFQDIFEPKIEDIEKKMEKHLPIVPR